jgi:hypothetical protein
LKRLGLDVWHGIEWCYKTAPCREAVEKYGEEAVEAALEAAALQNLFLTGRDSDQMHFLVMLI